MRCIERLWRRPCWAAVLLAVLVAGCANRPGAPRAPSAAATASPGTAAPTRAPARAEPAQPTHAATGAPAVAPATAEPRFVKLGPPNTPRSWDDLRLQAAQRLVAAHPDTSYVGTPPSVLLAIPILEIELHADGSVRQIKVLRVPGQAQDTVQLAMAAVHRAAPFGDVSRLKKPWKFVETFLFDDDRRFMPRILDR